MLKRIGAAGLAALTLFAGAAYAQAPSPWLTRLRIVNIEPNESNTSSGPIGTDSIKVDNVWAPELDISYFINPNLALELVLTYPQKHDVSVNGIGDIGSIKQIPPSLFFQYHFYPAPQWKPYVGAGITYFRITDNNLSVPGAGAILNTRTSNWGGGLQVGVDYMINRNWYINADVKYIWVSTKITDNAGLGIDTTLRVNPWVYGVGVGYRF